MELGRTESDGFLPFGFRTREYDYLHAHFGGELDGQMPKPTDPYDADAITRK